MTTTDPTTLDGLAQQYRERAEWWSRGAQLASEAGMGRLRAIRQRYASHWEALAELTVASGHAVQEGAAETAEMIAAADILAGAIEEQR